MKNSIKYKLFGISALFIFGAIPCVANAFTAIAWSQSGQSGGSVKNAPTKDAAISAAIADCKKNGGGSDCQVFKVSDEPGFVALYGTCAKTCGVTAVTGRPTPEQARADAKRECETYYRANCQLAQEWEEAGTRTSQNKNIYINGEEWKFSKEGKTSTLWYLPSSIRRRGSIVGIKYMWHMHKPVRSYGAEVNYSIVETEWDCKREKGSLILTEQYSDFPDGKNPNSTDRLDREWLDKYSDSDISNLWQDVCGKPLSRKKAGNTETPIKTRRSTTTYSNGTPQHGNHEREFMEEQRRELRNECLNTGSCGGFNNFNDRQLYQQ